MLVHKRISSKMILKSDRSNNPVSIKKVNDFGATELINGNPDPQFSKYKLINVHPDLDLTKLTSIRAGANDMDDWG